MLWAGDSGGAGYGDLSAKHWEFLVLVRYPRGLLFYGHLPGIRAGQRSSRKRRGYHIILASTKVLEIFSTESLVAKI